MSATHHILLVDDDQTLRDALAEQLALYDEFKVSAAPNATASLKAVQAECIARLDLAFTTADIDDLRRDGIASPAKSRMESRSCRRAPALVRRAPAGPDAVSDFPPPMHACAFRPARRHPRDKNTRRFTS